VPSAKAAASGVDDWTRCGAVPSPARCWQRAFPARLNATAAQNPLTTLPEAVESAERVLAQQDGPTVLVGHSFSGMILTEAGVHPNVSALVYVAARAPDAGEDYSAPGNTYPTPPAPQKQRPVVLSPN
jgi:pimeloyl-ACP methyl ester carboxylesterase